MCPFDGLVRGGSDVWRGCLVVDSRRIMGVLAVWTVMVCVYVVAG